MIDLPAPRPDRVAVVGVGNELNGDDAAGVLVVRRMAELLMATPGVLLIDAGLAPENFTGPLRRFRPDLVVEVDAADLGKLPGSTSWIEPHDTDGLSASTHTLPPSVLAKFLLAELGCRVAVIGIQPLRLELNAPLSPAVERGVDGVAEQLCAWLGNW
jgi:hydrogenase 3 maturation protease